jgi:hypothetical protein
MGAIIVRVLSASRRPLDDRLDIEVSSTRSDATVARVKDVSGTSPVRITGLAETDLYRIQVFPRRHRPVTQVAFAGPDDSPSTVELHSPIHPSGVRSVRFPAYADLPRPLTRVLEQSTVDGIPGSGDALYAALTDVQKAGLLNLFSKMTGSTFSDGRTVWSFVDGVYAVRPDRIFVDVDPALRERVSEAVVANTFREVSGSLHEPPSTYCQAGSFKTTDPYGNLQLTFFCTTGDEPISYKVDADIDDAAGIGHAFQVIRNWVTDGTTHPYDIHQILVFRQDVSLPYELA